MFSVLRIIFISTQDNTKGRELNLTLIHNLEMGHVELRGKYCAMHQQEVELIPRLTDLSRLLLFLGCECVQYKHTLMTRGQSIINREPALRRRLDLSRQGREDSWGGSDSSMLRRQTLFD